MSQDNGDINSVEEIKEKILFFLKKRVDLPSFKETARIYKILSLKEKIAFLAFTAVFGISMLFIASDLSGKLLTEIPVSGGTLTEGVIGTPRFINPILAVSDTDRDMTALIYSGLLRPDEKGGLNLDMAEKYEISEDGLLYTFTLRQELVWHDNKPITSDDIIFTINQLKDSRIKSSKRAGWEGVKIKKIDDRTVRFILAKPYTPFLENAAIGILPKHIWEKIHPEQISFSKFNIEPIGSGPYKVKKISRNSSGIISSYILKPNKKFILGKPLIKKLELKFYPSEKELLEAYKKGDVDSISAISPQAAEKIKKSGDILKTPSLPRVFGVFFNHNNAKIFAKEETRKALNLATDKNRIITEVLEGYGVKLDYPIPPGIFGALDTEEAGDFSADVERAKSLLKKNGWKLNEETGILEKKIKKETLEFRFSLSTSDTPELKQTAELLKSMWKNIGVEVEIKIFEIGDLSQNVIRPRKYEALLFGEIIGRDPDPFAFWHSSQRNDPGLNIAMYANITVDGLLEEARAISDKDERNKKYKEFQKEVAKDMPAIFLYSPRFIYIIPEFLKMRDEIKNITIPSERFSQIHKWYIKTRKIPKIFAK